MNATNVKISVEATLALTEKEVRILNELAGYDLAGTILEHVTKQFTKAELDTVFNSLRDELKRIVAEAESTRQFMFGTLHCIPKPL